MVIELRRNRWLMRPHNMYQNLHLFRAPLLYLNLGSAGLLNLTSGFRRDRHVTKALLQVVANNEA